MTPRMRLKSTNGWFAAGREVEEALWLLSDSAFRLFVWICLRADRRSGSLRSVGPICTRSVKARVTIASDGEQALKILNSPGFTPDLIVLDLSVPKLDGMDVLARYRREKGEAPIVVFTNSANPKEQSRAMELGANEYLIKPRELDEYLSTIRGAIERWMGETAANGV